MLRLTPGHAEEAALVAAARAVPASSPAYPSLAFDRARLLIREGKLDEARALAAVMAKASAAWPPSAVNQLRAVQLRLATSFDGFLAAAIHQPVGFASDDDESPDGRLPAAQALSYDALDIVNERLPLSRLIDAAADAAWPEHLREEARLAALTRALLLDDRDAARRVDAEVRKAYPDLAAISTPWRPSTPEERRFFVSLLLSRRPGLRPFMTGGQRRSSFDWSVTPPTVTPDALDEPDQMRDNWWCALSPSSAGSISPISRACTALRCARRCRDGRTLRGSRSGTAGRVPDGGGTGAGRGRVAGAGRDRGGARFLRPRGAGLGGDALDGRAPGGGAAPRGAGDTSGMHHRREWRRLTTGVHAAPQALPAQPVGGADAVLVPLIPALPTVGAADRERDQTAGSFWRV